MEMKPGYSQTDVEVLPDEWEVKRLGDLGTFLKGRGVKKDEANGGDLPCIRYGEIYTHHADYIRSFYSWISPAVAATATRLRQGDLLFAGSGETKDEIGKCVAFIGGHEAFAGGDIVILRPAGLNSMFMGYYCNTASINAQKAGKGQGDAVVHISAGALSSIVIALPSLLEQQAIATALSDVDALLGRLDQLIAKKRNLKQAAIQQLLTGQTRLPGFQAEWETVEFGDVASIRNSKVLPSSTPAGTQCVELESIDQGTGQLLTSVEATGMSPKYSFRKGDVLFGRLRAYLRKYWLATFDGVCSTEIWPLIARDGRLVGSFLYVLVQTNDFVNVAAVSYGTHMPRTDWFVLKRFPVRLPPFHEQTAIAAFLSDMDAELTALDARRDKIRDLKQAMMQELLTGKSRLVPVGGANA